MPSQVTASGALDGVAPAQPHPGVTPAEVIRASAANRSAVATVSAASGQVRALYRRAAEAATIRVAATGILAGHGQDRRLVVLGDLNDTEQAATTQLLYGPPGSQYGIGGSATPTAVTGSGCGTWPRRFLRSAAIPASSKRNER